MTKAKYRVKWTRTDGTGVSKHYTVAGGAQSALAKALRDLQAPMLCCARVEVWESGYTDEALPLVRVEFPVYARAMAEVAA
jgi:hypothetical protein